MGLVTEIAIFLVATFVIMKVAPAAKLLPAAEPASRKFNPKALSATPTELRRLENRIFMTKSERAGIIGAYWRVVVILKDPKATLTNRLTTRDIAPIPSKTANFFYSTRSEWVEYLIWCPQICSISYYGAHQVPRCWETGKKCVRFAVFEKKKNILKNGPFSPVFCEFT